MNLIVALATLVVAIGLISLTVAGAGADAQHRVTPLAVDVVVLQRAAIRTAMTYFRADSSRNTLAQRAIREMAPTLLWSMSAVIMQPARASWPAS